MATKKVPYSDGAGRKFLSVLPSDASDMEASRGVMLGPSGLGSLGLPREVELRLHNELFARGVHTARDARSRRYDVLGALMAALRVDVEAVVNALSVSESELESESSEGGIGGR